MASRVVRRVWRELAEPERCAWARLMARMCGVALRERRRFYIIVRDGAR